MITTFNEYYRDQINTEPLDQETQDLIDEVLRAFVPKICILESQWSDQMTNSLSVKPFFDALGSIIKKEIVVAHRFIDDAAGLFHYVHHPEGVIYNDPDLAGIDVFYIGSHGIPGGLQTPMSIINSEDLIRAFNGLAMGFNLVYFAGCDVFKGFKGQQFAKRFLEQTGTMAVIGYAEKAQWVDGLLIDLLFLSRFYSIEGNAFEQLQNIYESVIQDYPRSMECDFQIYLNEEYK